MRTFCHNVQVVPQQVPPRNAGGDCFACAVTAAVQHIYPEAPPTFDDVFEAFQEELTTNTGEKWQHTTNTWHGMRKALYRLWDKWPLEIFADLVLPQTIQPEQWSYSWGVPVNPNDYGRRLDAWLRAGHIALAEVMLHPNQTGEWALLPDGKVTRHHIDHFIVIDGMRSGWRKHETVKGASSLVYQAHVVCSALGGRAYWMDVDDLTLKHGTGGWWLIRKYGHETLEE